MTFEYSHNNDKSFCSKFLKQYDSCKHKFNPNKPSSNLFMNTLSKRLSNQYIRPQRLNNSRILWKKYETENFTST